MLHPFYIFQIASIILWSLDSYYYYAICIFAMSVGSITTTLFETRAVSTGYLADPNLCAYLTFIDNETTARNLPIRM